MAGTVLHPPQGRPSPSIFRGTFCAAKHTISCIRYLSKTHFVRDLPQKVKVEDMKTKLSCEMSLKKWNLKLQSLQWQSLQWLSLQWQSLLRQSVLLTIIVRLLKLRNTEVWTSKLPLMNHHFHRFCIHSNPLGVTISHYESTCLLDLHGEKAKKRLLAARCHARPGHWHPHRMDSPASMYQRLGKPR